MENKKYSKSLFTFVYFIFVAMVVFGLGFFIVDRITVNRPSMISYYCYELDGWEQIRGDERIPLRMPDEFVLEKGEPLIMEAKLPDTIYGDTWIDYYSAKHFVMYIDGEQRFEHPSPGQYTVPGGIVKTLHVYMPVFPDDAGKTIRLVRSGEEDNGGKILEIYIGTGLGLVERIITKNIKHFVLAVSLMVIAVISIMVGVILKVTHKGNPNISSVGVGVFFVALWLILDSELFQFAFRDYYIDGTVSFIVSLLIPLPFLYYLDTLQKHRYTRFLLVEVFLFELLSVTATAFNFLNILNYLETFPILAIAEVLIIAVTVGELVIDIKKKYYKQYLLSFIGLCGFAFSCMIELLLIFTVEDRIDGDVLIWGLYFLLIMAVFQEIFYIREHEKIRNMAIIASEAKTNFLANMSHEIRTPMNAILGMCEMILREAEDETKVRKYAGNIKSAGSLLLSLINDILDITKVESGKAELICEDFEICSVLNDIANIAINRATDKGLTFDFDVSETIPYRFYGDEIRIRQIILNVVNNAIKYTNKGGVSVEVMFKYDETEAYDKGILRIKVKDTGIGIKEEDIGKLFNSFSRLEESRNRNIEGTGLGLYITYTYITLMGGDIDVSSVYGQGSVFTLYIPLKVTDRKEIGKFSEAIKNLNDNSDDYRPIIMAPKARVLMVDDNEMNLSVAGALLKDTKIKVDNAYSGPEAIEKAKDNKYDIIYLDQMMPGMDGIQTLKALKDSHLIDNVPVIVLTADAIAGAKEFYLGNGFTDYLSKPIKPEELENSLIKYLPKNLLLSREEIARLYRHKDVIDESELKTLLIIDPDPETLKELREKFTGTFKSTLVTDVAKAEKYLEKHTVDFVLTDGKLYVP